MNVFRLHGDPSIAAEHHCDQHINKMLVESAQLLSGALRVRGVDDEHLYERTHEGHPLFEWVAEGRENFAYVHELAEGLYEEKKNRFGGGHSSWDDCVSKIDRRPGEIPEGGTSQPLAMPDCYKLSGVVESYREYYFHDKSFASWSKGRDKPGWYYQMQVEGTTV